MREVDLIISLLLQTITNKKTKNKSKAGKHSPVGQESHLSRVLEGFTVPIMCPLPNFWPLSEITSE